MNLLRCKIKLFCFVTKVFQIILPDNNCFVQHYPVSIRQIIGPFMNDLFFGLLLPHQLVWNKVLDQSETRQFDKSLFLSCREQEQNKDCKIHILKVLYKYFYLCCVSNQESEDTLLAEGTLAESLRAAAEAAVSQTGFIYDEGTGLYYDHSTGFYYNSVNTVFCSLIINALLSI